MTIKRTDHLNEDQLIRSLVEEVDLPPNLREHLTVCAVCKATKQKMEARLERLGELARESSPPPRRKVRLSEFDRRHVQPFWWGWNWRSLCAAGFGAALLLLMLTNMLPTKDKPENRTAQLEREMTEDEQLLDSVDRLEENALPTFYVEVSDLSDPDFDEDFIDFVVPADDNKSSHLEIRRKGKLC